MDKQLPVAWNDIPSVYLHPALLLSIMKASGQYENWLHMNFINVYASVYEKGDLLCRNGYLKLFYESTAPQELHSFFRIKEWNVWSISAVEKNIYATIDENEYVLLDLDEFYIQGTYYYHRVHYFRRFLFWGYHKEKAIFYTISHDKFTKLSNFYIHKENLLEALVGRLDGEKIPNGSNSIGLSIKLKTGLFQQIPYNPYSIYLQLLKYHDGYQITRATRTDDADTTDYFGFILYDLLIDRIQQSLKNIVKYDYRAIGMLVEQKAGLARRLEYLSKQTGCNTFDSSIYEFRVMSEDARKILLQLLRYGSSDDNVRQRVGDICIKKLQEIREKDRLTVDKLLISLENIPEQNRCI